MQKALKVRLCILFDSGNTYVVYFQCQKTTITGIPLHEVGTWQAQNIIWIYRSKHDFQKTRQPNINKVPAAAIAATRQQAAVKAKYIRNEKQTLKNWPKGVRWEAEV